MARWQAHCWPVGIKGDKTKGKFYPGFCTWLVGA